MKGIKIVQFPRSTVLKANLEGFPRLHGTVRRLSEEVGELLRSNLPLLVLREGAKSLGIPVERTSDREIAEGRPPEVRGSSAEIVKEMRARS